MLTDDNIKKLMQVFATKQEIAEIKEQMATKDDVSGSLVISRARSKDFRRQ